MQQVATSVRTDRVNLPVGELAEIIHQCYQCGKCSAGCPVAPEMDLLPHQLVRLAVLGDVEPILASKSIWLCLTCHTCGARCPNGIDVPTLLDPIRHQVLQKKITTQESNVPTFHTAFMKNVRMFGRVFELGLVGMYKLKTKTYFDDMRLGMAMFKKGKMHLKPYFASTVSQVKAMFKDSAMK